MTSWASTSWPSSAVSRPTRSCTPRSWACTPLAPMNARRNGSSTAVTFSTGSRTGPEAMISATYCRACSCSPLPSSPEMVCNRLANSWRWARRASVMACMALSRLRRSSRAVRSRSMTTCPRSTPSRCTLCTCARIVRWEVSRRTTDSSGAPPLRWRVIASVRAGSKPTSVYGRPTTSAASVRRGSSSSTRAALLRMLIRPSGPMPITPSSTP